MATGTVKKINSYTFGTDGVWKYRKYDDGTYHAWYDTSVTLASGTAYAGGYYHATNAGLTAPSFSRGITAVTGASTNDQICMYSGANRTTLVTYWFNGTQQSLTIPVRINVYGIW